VNYRTYQHQRSSPEDRLSSIAMMNVAGSPARSTSNTLFYAASVFFLVQSTGAPNIVDRFIYGDGSLGGDKVTQTLNLLGILTSIFLFWAGTSKIEIARFNRALPLAAPSLLLISVLWSVDPAVTLTQGTVYFFVVLGAIGLVEASDGDVLLDLMALVCVSCAVASALQFFAHPEPGDFRGIFSHKNVLGQVMAGGVLAGLHGARVKRGRSFRYICVIALCTIVAFMSKSSTSILTIFVLFWLDMLGRVYLKGGTLRLLGICLAIASIPVVIFFVTNEDLLLDILGKDKSLTGRTAIWTYAVAELGEKPILGWGFCGFWSSLNPVAAQIREAIRGEGWWTPPIPNAHNAMLEFLLEIGVVGTMLFLFLLLRNLMLAAKCLMNRQAGQFGLTSALLLASILLVGVSEDVLLAGQQLSTGLFFMMGFICEKQLSLGRARGGRVSSRYQTSGRIAAANIVRGSTEPAKSRDMR
jgi:exopolysaccharide production protein ExoQ